jgi:signal transduction histidine kinase
MMPPRHDHPPGAATGVREAWVATQLIHTFMRQARPPLHAACALIVIVLAMLYGQVDSGALWLWAAAAAAATALRYGILRTYRLRLAQDEGAALRAFMARHAWTWPLSAVAWGALMLVVYRKAPVEDQLLCMTILVAIAVVAVTSSPPSLRSLSAYCNGLFASVLAAMGLELSLALSLELRPGFPLEKDGLVAALEILGEMALVLVFWMLARVFGRRMYRAQRNNLELQFDRRDLINSLADRKRAALEAEAVRSRFIASAAHELRYPVHALGLYAGWLAAEPEFAAQIARKIADSTRKIDELFESLFNLAGLDPASLEVQRQPVALAALVHELAADHAPLAREKRLRLRVRARAGQALSDPVLLKRLVGSLLSNALRNTHGGGVLLAVRQRKGRWRIELWDTGAGIAHERQQTFFQGIPELGTEEGFGLELAAVYRLSQVLGHPVGMATRHTGGCVFWVDLARY